MLRLKRDEETLRRVAERTRHFCPRHGSCCARQRHARHRPLERTEVPIREVRDHRELFPVVLLTGLLMLGLQSILGATWLRSVP